MARFTFTTAIDPSGALSGARDLRRRIAGSPIELTISRKSLAQPLGRITGDVAEFTKSLQAATARVTAFGATSGGIIAVSRALSEVVGSVIEVDKQLTELNTFLGQSQSRLGVVGDSLFKIAKNTASSFGDVAEAAKEFARQGLSVEETLKRTNDALILSRISGLGAAESVNALTTAINSFNKSGLDSSEIINKLVKVDTNFAVSSADLAQALTRVGSAAQDSGVSFEELISVVTTAQQVTGRGGAIIGNALKTIFTRLKRPEVLDQLQQLGVAVKDQNGSLLNGVQVLSNYIAATKNLSQIEKARNDELLGGVYQINQLKAITSDLGKANGIYARSLQIANSATDDAIQKNEQLNQSLSATLQNLKTNFQQRGGSIGEPLVKPLVKRAAGAANLLLDVFGVEKGGGDKEGKQLGETLGQSLLKGVGDALAGPGLVLVGGLFLNIGKRLTTFVLEASKVLLNINSVASNTKAIEEAINNTLANQPKLLDAIARGQITREQAAAQLLRLFSQQNQQLILQKSLASSLAGTFARGGFVASQDFGIYRGRPQTRRSEGYIPNYALQQERSEAISKGARNPVPYFAKVTIGGREQVAAVNDQETIIPNYGGGRDTAIIPNYRNIQNIPSTVAKGYIPNFASVFNPGKHIKQGGSIGRANKPTATGLQQVLGEAGISVSEEGITRDNLQKVLSTKENKLKIFNFLRKSPILVGKYPEGYSEVKDGNHRFELAQLAGIKNIPTIPDRMSSGYIPNFAGLGSTLLMRFRKAQRTLSKGRFDWLSPDTDMTKYGYAFKMPAGSYFPRTDEIKLNKNQHGQEMTETLHHEGIHMFLNKTGIEKKLRDKAAKLSDKEIEELKKVPSVARKIKAKYPKEMILEEALADSSLKVITDREILNKHLNLTPRQIQKANRLSNRLLDAAYQGVEKRQKWAWASGYIPNFADQIKYYSSNSELRDIIQNQKPGQKFFSLTFETEKGLKEQKFDEASIVRKAGSQFGVRRDLIKGKNPPKGFNSWKEFWDARGIAPVRRTKTRGEEDSGFRSRRLDRVVEAKIGGVIYRPSPQLAARNTLTKSFNAKELRKMGASSFTRMSSEPPQVSALSPEAAKKILETAVPFRQRFARGYIPNYAAPRYFSPSARFSGPSSSGFARPGQTMQTPQERSSFDSVISSAVTSALYTFLPVALASSSVSEENQSNISGLLKGLAALSVAAGAIRGGKTGGVKGAVTGTLGASITGGALYFQGASIGANVQAQVFEKSREKAQNAFNKLTENITGLSQTISDLDNLYSDPNAKPDALIRLGKKEQELLRKLEIGNPAAATAYRIAQTPEEKQKALAESNDKAQRELSLSKSILDFSQLSTAQRDAKAVTSFFKDLAGQLNREKVNIESLNQQNFSDFLKQGGLGKASNVFGAGDAGKQLSKFFIDFLKTQDRIAKATADQDKKILNLQAPLIALRNEVSRRQEIRGVTNEARQGFLSNVEKFASNFGDRASIETKAQIDKYNLSKSEKETFANRLFVESQGIKTGGIKNMVDYLAAQGPGKGVESMINTMIKDYQGKDYAKEDIEILKRILAQNTTSTKKLETIDQTVKIQKDYALKALSLQEKLNFAGGIKTSIDATSKIDSFRNTQRGALQFQLGSLLGSNETQVAGLTNFASNLKEKYPGLFQGKGGDAIFGNIRDQLTQARAFDIRRSLASDAMSARGIGQFGMANFLESKLRPENFSEIFKIAQLQAEQQLGMKPSITEGFIGEEERQNKLDIQAKRQENADIRNVENALAPALNAITESFVKQIEGLQAPLNEAIQNTFSKGLEIGNATLIAKSLDLGSLFGQGQQNEGVISTGAPSKQEIDAFRAERDARRAENRAGGFIPNFSMAGDLADSINREKTALKDRGYNPIMPANAGYIPNFAAQIQVGQSSKLVNSRNPMGLAVTNTVDEPRGLASIGLASGGYIPNFARRPSKKDQQDLQAELQAELLGEPIANRPTKKSKPVVKEAAPKLSKSLESGARAEAEAAIISGDIQEFDNSRAQSLLGNEKTGNKAGEQRYFDDVQALAKERAINTINSLINSVEEKKVLAEDKLKSLKPKSKEAKSLRDQLQEYKQNLEELNALKVGRSVGPPNDLTEQLRRFNESQKSLVKVAYNPETNQYEVEKRAGDNPEYVGEPELTDEQIKLLEKLDKASENAERKQGRGAYNIPVDRVKAAKEIAQGQNLKTAKQITKLKNELALMKKASVGTPYSYIDKNGNEKRVSFEFFSEEAKQQAIEKLNDLIAKTTERGNLLGLFESESKKTGQFSKGANRLLSGMQFREEESSLEARQKAIKNAELQNKANEIIFRSELPTKESAIVPSLVGKIQEIREQQALRAEESVRRLSEGKAYKPSAAAQINKLISPSLGQINQPATVVPPIAETPVAKPATTTPPAATPPAAPTSAAPTAPTTKPAVSVEPKPAEKKKTPIFDESGQASFLDSLGITKGGKSPEQLRKEAELKLKQRIEMMKAMEGKIGTPNINQIKQEAKKLEQLNLFISRKNKTTGFEDFFLTKEVIASNKKQDLIKAQKEAQRQELLRKFLPYGIKGDVAFRESGGFAEMGGAEAPFISRKPLKQGVREALQLIVAKGVQGGSIGEVTQARERLKADDYLKFEKESSARRQQQENWWERYVKTRERVERIFQRKVPGYTSIDQIAKYNSENSGMARNIIDAINRESGFGSTDIEKLTGVSPARLEKLKAFDLNNLLKDRGIAFENSVLNLNNAKAFQEAGGENLLNQLRSGLEERGRASGKGILTAQSAPLAQKIQLAANQVAAEQTPAEPTGAETQTGPTSRGNIFRRIIDRLKLKGGLPPGQTTSGSPIEGREGSKFQAFLRGPGGSQIVLPFSQMNLPSFQGGEIKALLSGLAQKGRKASGKVGEIGSSLASKLKESESAKAGRLFIKALSDTGYNLTLGSKLGKAGLEKFAKVRGFGVEKLGQLSNFGIENYQSFKTSVKDKISELTKLGETLRQAGIEKLTPFRNFGAKAYKDFNRSLSQRISQLEGLGKTGLNKFNQIVGFGRKKFNQAGNFGTQAYEEFKQAASARASELRELGGIGVDTYGRMRGFGAKKFNELRNFGSQGYNEFKQAAKERVAELKDLGKVGLDTFNGVRSFGSQKLDKFRNLSEALFEVGVQKLNPIRDFSSQAYKQFRQSAGQKVNELKNLGSMGVDGFNKVLGFGGKKLNALGNFSSSLISKINNSAVFQTGKNFGKALISDAIGIGRFAAKPIMSGATKLKNISTTATNKAGALASFIFNRAQVGASNLAGTFSTTATGAASRLSSLTNPLVSSIGSSLSNVGTKGLDLGAQAFNKAGSFIFGLPQRLGYYSPKDIPRNAAKLLKLERSLRENPAFKDLSEQAKKFIVDDFLKQQGSFADEVQRVSQELLNRSNLKAVSKEAIDFSNKIDPSKSPLRNFIETQNYLAQQVAKGKLTPGEAAKLQERIFLKEKGVLPNEYADILKRASKYRKGNLFTRSDNEAFYQAAGEQGGDLQFKTSNDFIRERMAKDDFKTAQKRMRGFGVKWFGTHSLTGADIFPFDSKTWEFGEGLSSFSESRVQANRTFEDQYRKGIITKDQRDASIQEVRKALSRSELSESAKFAETLGFEYNPFTGKLKDPFLKPEPAAQIPQGRVGEGDVKLSPSEKVERILGGKTFGKYTGVGMGVVGLGLGYLEYQRAKQEQDEVGQNLIVAETGLSSLGALSFVEKLQGRLGGEEMAGRLGGTAFAAAASIGSFRRFRQEYGENKNRQASLSVLGTLSALGAAGASVLKQTKLSGNLFSTLGAINQFKAITSAPNFQVARLSEEDKKSGFLNKIAKTGLLAATGQTFQGFSNMNYEQKAEVLGAAAATVIGDLFNLKLGQFGVGLTGWRIGYSIGNVIEDELGIGENLGNIISSLSGNPFGKNRSTRASAAGYRIKKKDEFADEAEYKKYLNKELSEGLKLSEYSLGDFMNSGISLLLSPLEYFQNKAGGFIPNFAAGNEEDEKNLTPEQREAKLKEETAKAEAENRAKIVEGIKNNEDTNELYTSRDKANYLLERENIYGSFTEKDFGGDKSLYESYVAARGEKQRAEYDEKTALSDPKVKEFREQAAKEAAGLSGASGDVVKEAYNRGVTVESLQRRDQTGPYFGPAQGTDTVIDGVIYSEDKVREAYNRGVAVESLGGTKIENKTPSNQEDDSESFEPMYNDFTGFPNRFYGAPPEEDYVTERKERPITPEEQAKIDSKNRSKIVKGVKENEDLNQLYTSRDKANYLIEQEKIYGAFTEKDFGGDKSLYETYKASKGEKQERENAERKAQLDPKTREFRQRAAREADALRNTPQEEINEAYKRGVTVEKVKQRKQEKMEEFTRKFEENSPESLTINSVGKATQRTPEITINGVNYLPQEIKEASDRGMSVESLREYKKEEAEAKRKGISVSELRQRKAKQRIGALNSRSRNNYSGYVPNFASAFLAESLAIKTSSDYAGFSNAKPEMSSIYPNVVMNSAEKEVPVERVYAAMGFPGAKPKNPSETHAILNPRQQRDLGIANQGFVPNFSNEEFAMAITEAMKNGISAAFNGFIPNFAAGQTSNIVNINDNRVQNSMQANPGVFEAVMDVLVKMHPKEMASIGPKITKVS